ncbi:MAG: 50S ribosomal protein L28 [Clostridia bacterium]|nr:50S ribosomal protein L28 [Clostridia bacterium]MBR2070641.1 50S ribosomal protein L28 [Clostridia bacterium]MBR2160060.1 50S ribosomal protein L28 [Clostridia bacterium]MBR2397955.1 50S ribosomal protein L28 [Clostridia bacterium]MBR2874272.1 50S ribosomal protein L28 [Clostridia bacterium]
MSKVCSICGKGSMSGNLVSHSNRKTPRSLGANVQKVKIVKGGKVESCYVCTSCLKSGKVERA